MNGNTFGDGDLVPRALVERLLEPEDPFSVGSDRPRLFVGRLPQGLPVDLVVPEGFEVLGGRIVSEEPRGEDGLEVVLDASMPASEALDAYRARLLSDGWSEPERREMRHGGFGVRPAGEPALFCRSERGPALFLRARDRRDDRTDVRLTLITSTRHSPCSPRAREPFFEPVIPDLSPPPDSRLFPQGGGDSDDSAHFAATLETTLDLAFINSHYAAQLAEAGWTHLDTGEGGPQTWSSWTFRDEEGQRWCGLLLVIRLPETPHQHLLQLHANRIPEAR